MGGIAGKRIVDRRAAQGMQESADLENIVVRQLSLPGRHGRARGAVADHIQDLVVVQLAAQRHRQVVNDLRPDLTRAAIGAVAGGAVLVVTLLALRDRLAVAGERIGRAAGRRASLRQGWQKGQGKNQPDEKSFGQRPRHGFFSAAGAVSGRPKVRMLVPDAIARYW